MLKLILLPGMDGTGKLFEPLTLHLRPTFEIEAVQYPPDQILSYPELESLVESALPKSEPFLLLAESFSTPLAVTIAARNHRNLKGLILCAGFVTSPVRGWRRVLASRAAPILFNRTLPDFAIRKFLTGPTTPPELLANVRATIASVDPKVLAHRLSTILTSDARADLKRIYPPILYLRAQQDRLVGSSSLQEIRQIKPHVTVAGIAGPHLLLQREPERCAEVIKAWARTLTQCTICKRELEVAADPLSGDCGGDCWGCISQVEADSLGIPLDDYRANPGKFLPRT